MSFLRTCSAVLVLLQTAASSVLAQTAKPIYVQYEGFVKQPDNTLLVSFGYINLNDADIVIAAGEQNQFVPPPGNRNQPVTFQKGRHRSVCVMLLPADFDGVLRWSVKNGEHLSITTARVLDPQYALEEASAKRAATELTLANVKEAVCLKPDGAATPR